MLIFDGLIFDLFLNFENNDNSPFALLANLAGTDFKPELIAASAAPAAVLTIYAWKQSKWFQTT